MENFIHNFQNHPELAALFGDKKVHIEIWVLRQPEIPQDRLKLAYCLISPAKTDATAQWRTSSFKPVFSDKTLSTRKPAIAKISITIAGNQANKLIEALYNGHQLQPAASQLNLPTAPAAFSSLSMGIFSLPKDEFAIRPPIMAIPKNIQQREAASYQGISSPIDDAVATVGTIFRLKKEAFWQDRQGNPLIYAKEILNGIVSILSAETALNFHRSDIKRLGNIEWINFNSLDAHESRYCSVETIKELVDKLTKQIIPETKTRDPRKHFITCKGIVVTIAPDAFTGETSILIQCAAYNSNDLIEDQVKTGVCPTDLSFKFNFSEPISGATVRVWKKTRNTHYTLWHHERFDLFRSVSVSVSDDFSRIPKSEWIDELISPEIPTNPKSFQPNPFFTFSPRLNEYFSLDPWNPIGSEIFAFNQRINPPTSDASFFIPTSEDDTSRVKALADWLSEVITGRNAATCIILDPFFDTLGIDVLIATQARKTELIAVANCQCRSENDERQPITTYVLRWIKSLLPRNHNKVAGIAKHITDQILLKLDHERTPNRAKRLQNYCEKNLDQLKEKGIRVVDIRSKSSSTKQYFHDRYVLLFNEKGRLNAGFCLSNSIQGAMKRFPLLIAPIPDDLLEPVQDYIQQNLIRKSVNNEDRNIVSIFSTHDTNTKRATLFKTGLDALSDPRVFFSILLGNSDIAKMTVENLSIHLRELNLLDETGSFFLPANPYIDNIILYLERSDIDFLKSWNDLAEFLVRLRESESFLEKISTSKLITDKLTSFILKPPENIINNIDEQNKYLTDIDNILSNSESMPFGTALSRARNISLSTFQEHYSRSYFFIEAIEVISFAGPSVFVDVIENMMRIQTSHAITAFLKGKMMDRLMWDIGTQPSPELLERLSSSKNYLLKAIAAIAIYHYVPRSDNFPDFDWFKKYFTLQELLLILSEWIYDLRVKANQKGGQEPEEVKILRTKLMSFMLGNWVQSQGLLKEVVEKCEGPGFGNWALSNYNELCLPLLEAAHCSWTDLGSLWLAPLIEKIENCAQDKAFFYGPADSRLTAVAAHVLVNLPERERSTYFAKIDTLVNANIQQLGRPRIKSINYSVWDSRTRAQFWIQTFILHVLSYTTNLTQQEINSINKHIQDGAPFTWNSPDFVPNEFDQLLVWVTQARYNFQNSASQQSGQSEPNP